MYVVPLQFKPQSCCVCGRCGHCYGTTGSLSYAPIGLDRWEKSHDALSAFSPCHCLYPVGCCDSNTAGRDPDLTTIINDRTVFVNS